ncbi:hypothetical protein BDV33DRAFT_210310 [Aspergillus novoparasiticus]|uniref:Uncharacterized protein n=1 Tax=Aspergillus novoparasiticus TaxID=986946 RepID=A0A5N6E6Y5_9EURO|nr:hypothetical protein BDV33DRAFT_210310 [Aspergillus novoparasiticus]
MASAASKGKEPAKPVARIDVEYPLEEELPPVDANREDVVSHLDEKLHGLSAMDRTAVRVLGLIRVGAARGSGDKVSLNNKNHKSAYVLYRRGLVASAPCRKCVKHCRPYEDCVVSPSFEGVALYAGACANCLCSGKGSECSLREAFEAAGGRNIDPGSVGHIIAHGGLALASFKEFRRLVASEDESDGAVEFIESDEEAIAPAARRVPMDEAVVVPDDEIATSPPKVASRGDSVALTERESAGSVAGSEAGTNDAGLVATLELFGATQTKLQCSVDAISGSIVEIQRGIKSLHQELERVQATFRDGFKVVEELKGSIAALKNSATIPPPSSAPVVSDDPFVDDPAAPPAKRARSSRRSVGDIAASARLLLTQFQFSVTRSEKPVTESTPGRGLLPAVSQANAGSSSITPTRRPSLLCHTFDRMEDDEEVEVSESRRATPHKKSK